MLVVNSVVMITSYWLCLLWCLSLVWGVVVWLEFGFARPSCFFLLALG